ncbi:helix-turn-helix domain-containing protein [Ornithinicoccus hortensis]|uniref:Excisionase family DNA binding protein n=1 Tax=Ornithinicoccus hortensis TaxID=82346 RepID=A0A542YQK5_9MICO|nr:helix-turn-helix domain-containing protein [Ornithinicoccus hortensis]TQL50349.1 excisionase family DNA binding protein [Ornithinicoccus hortensis]
MPRFLTLTDVAETLNVTLAQAKALVRSGALAGIKVGGRGVWRVEDSALEDYIQRMYAETRESIARGEELAESEPDSDSEAD